jgi:hypothetical protein
MKIKMRTTAAGPAGNKMAGHEYLVSEEEGKILCDGGYASLVVTPKPIPPARAAAPVKVETAAVKPPETAAAAPQSSKGPAAPPKK